MTNDEIKQSILNFIEEDYYKKYIGKLWIYNLDPIGYKVVFGLNNNDKPIVICAELKEKEFLKFIKKEIHDKAFDFVKYFIGTKTYPNNCYEK